MKNPIACSKAIINIHLPLVEWSNRDRAALDAELHLLRFCCAVTPAFRSTVSIAKSL